MEAVTGSSAPIFSFLGLGSRNSEVCLEPTASATDSAGAAVENGFSSLAAQLVRTLKRLGSSLEELAYEGAAESLSSWDAGQMSGALMVMALLRRRPDDIWLRDFWSVSAAKLPECTAADLAMLSFGLSELGLRPPEAWTDVLLAATLRLAEAPDVDAVNHEVAPGGVPAAVQQARSVAPRGEAPGVEAGMSLGLGSGERHDGLTAAVLPSPQHPTCPPSASAAASDGAAGSSTRRIAGGVADARDTAATAPLHSAYDLEDMYGSAATETSSGLAAALLAPVRALWRGAQAAAGAVTASWRRGRSASDLVTVLYNSTSAGLLVDADWLGRFLEAMRTRMAFLSGDDLRCLLTVAVEEGCGGGRGGCLVEPSREWQAALFGRMDGINWSMQSRNLVECLRAVTTLGLRPPRPWLRRQLLTLQPSLTLLPNAALAQLASLLPALPLLPLAPTAAAAATATVTDPAAAGAASTPASAAAPAAPQPSAAPSAAAASDAARAAGADRSQSSGSWLEAWLADFRTVAAERRDTMTPAELLNVLLGVSAVSASGAVAPSHAAASAPAPAPAPYLRSAGASQAEWRGHIVAALVERLPESSLPGLCEAWQVLAEAEQQQRDTAGPAAATAAAAAAPGGGAGAGQLSELRTLVADGLATHHAQQLSTSDVAPLLSSLASAGLPLPAAALDALLACAQPLLPGLTAAELVTVSLSLVRLAHKPNMAWQAAFCAATRRRLGLMTPSQRCSLLVAAASIGLHLPQPWVRDFFALSERAAAAVAAAGAGRCDEARLSGPQLADMLWAVSCVTPEPPPAWLERWEVASMSRLRDLGPNMLAVVLKAMSTLHHRPSQAWQSAYFSALQRRLFAAGAAQLQWPIPAPKPEPDPSPRSPPDADSAATPAAGTQPGMPTPSLASTASQPPLDSPGMSPSPAASTASPSSRPAPGTVVVTTGGGSGGGMLSAAVTSEALNSIVYSLAALDIAPPAAWLDDLMDAVRCKLSLLSTLDLSVVLAYLVARSHRPSDEWWESFLEALGSRFGSLSAGELASLLVMLHALRVSPSAHWLDAFCATTEPRLAFFQPPHLLQVLSCLHLFRHRPGQSWMAAYAAAVEACLPRFSPTELARVLMLLDHLNQRPGAAFMSRFYDTSRPGLAQLDTQELVNVAWAVVSCSVVQPDVRWTDALVAAARPRVSSLQQPQLRVLVAALGHMQRGAPSDAAADFLAFAREFLVL